jgi:hypothetical protein
VVFGNGGEAHLARERPQISLEIDVLENLTLFFFFGIRKIIGEVLVSLKFFFNYRFFGKVFQTI